MNSTLRITALAFGACFVTFSDARQCSKPPVRNSEQAVCYATVYAEKHGLRHVRPLANKVTKGGKVWTVRFADTRPDKRGGGWDVDVDVASGSVTRFRSYKVVER